MKNNLYIDALNSKSPFIIRDYLYDELSPILKENRPIIFVCIGTDRSTGDSLGPLVGEKLKFSPKSNIYVYGNLENPVHAKNIKDTLKDIKKRFKCPYIIAIDACLGSLDNVGKIIIEKKPIYPGMAVNKDLPPVGDLSIMGVVNVSGNLEFMVLQNTRLYTVMTIANTIYRGIHHYSLKSLGSKNPSINSILENIL